MDQKEMAAKIKKADTAYFDDDNPIMSDQEYDLLVQDYERQYGSVNSVSGGTRGEFQSFPHPISILSLDKLYADDPDFEQRLLQIADKLESVILQPKYDGLTVVAYPNSDFSCTYVTRGRGGLVGETLPNFISLYEGHNINFTGYPVRGEVILTKKDFEKIRSLQIKNNEEPFQNIRNAAAGILRRKERSPYIDYLKFVAYDLIGCPKTEEDKLFLISKKTEFHAADTIFPDDLTFGWEGNGLVQAISAYWSVLENGYIPVDGIVLKSNLPNSRNLFGETGHHPNNAIAYKPGQEEHKTQIRGIEWQVGRTKITPVAQLDPIEIDETIVSRATLHNIGFIERLGILQNDTIAIIKSGSVIPKVLRVIRHNIDSKPFEIPTHCPCCGHPVSLMEHFEKNVCIKELECTNDSCEERLVQAIVYLASKSVLDIEGISLQTARKLVEAGVKETTDIFDWTLEQWKSLPGYGDVSAQNIYYRIQEKLSQEHSLSTVIQATGVPGIGKDIGNVLDKRFGGSLELFREALEYPDDLKGIPGIGPKTINSLISSKFIWNFNNLADNYLKVSPPRVVPVSEASSVQVFGNTTWAITGKFEVPRKEIERLIESVGGKPVSSVSKKTDFLLIADVNSSSSKAIKARQLGIKLVDFNFLKEALNNV